MKANSVSVLLCSLSFTSPPRGLTLTVSTCVWLKHTSLLTCCSTSYEAQLWTIPLKRPLVVCTLVVQIGSGFDPSWAQVRSSRCFVRPAQTLWPLKTSALDSEGGFCTNWRARTEQVFMLGTHSNNSCFHWLVPLCLAQGQLIREMHCCPERLQWETCCTWL